MAKTREYMDYLDKEIGIAPANSQEEFQAAETIVEVMKDHGLEPTIQEFDAHPLGSLMPSILMVVMFLGILFCGLGSTVMRALGLLLAVAPAVILLVAHSGNEFLDGIGPASKSQNVVGVHRATGDKVTKGNRPIVIVAHYDTPHESAFFGRLAGYQSTIRIASVPCVVVVLVAAIIQILMFLPVGLRVVAWIVGLIAALLLVLLAAVSLAERFSTCTIGANDNKSSVAALLSVLDRVRPMDDRVSSTEGSDEDGDSEAWTRRLQKDGEETSDSAGQAVLGVRHGKEVLEQLGILPETCEIVYEDIDVASAGQPQAKGPADESYVEDTTEAEPQIEEDYYEPENEVAQVDESVEPWESAEQTDEFPSEDYSDVDYESGGDEAESYDANLSADDNDAEDDSSFEEEEWNTESSYDTTYGESVSSYDTSWDDGTDYVAKKGVGERLREAFQSLRERMARHKSADDVSIPRGSTSDASDFSEFEETDWGEDEWSDSSYQPQEELRPINRDEMLARRSSSEEAGWQGSADEAPLEDLADGAGQQEDYADNPEPVEWGDEEEYPIQDDLGSSEAEQYEVDVSSDDSSADSDNYEYEQPAKGRTSHDISHDDGRDWSVVEEEQAEDENLTVDFDPGIYDHQDEEPLEDLYDFDSASLEDVEDELEGDQLAGARPESTAEDSGTEPATDEAYSDDTQGNSPHDKGHTDRGEWQDDGLDWDDVSYEQTEGDDVLPKDTSGLDNMSGDYEVYGSGEPADEQLDEPEPIDDPTWGHTSYEPPRPKTNVARRATLYDVPNPSDDVVDPLSDENGDEEEKSEENRSGNWKGGGAVRSDLLGRDDDEFDGPYDEDGSEQYDPVDDYGQIDEAGEGYDASDDNQGEEEFSGLDEGDVQDAILSMADDLLISHDIWFVAVGCSSVNHAGMKAFLSNFRQDIRGAFLINLDSIGAGTPTLLTSEGLHAGRRADRRLVRLLGKVADDLHVDIQKASYRWNDTDATPAMRARVRAVTIMGMDGNGLPALSHTQNDVPENVDPAQVSSIVRVITEVIRRS